MAKYTDLEKVWFPAEIAAERAKKEAEEKRKIENTGTQKTKTKEGYAEHNKKETKTRAEEAYHRSADQPLDRVHPDSGALRIHAPASNVCDKRGTVVRL